MKPPLFLVTVNEASSSISTFTLDNKLGVLQNYAADLSVGAEPQYLYTIYLASGQIMMYVLNRAGKSITTLHFDKTTNAFVRSGPDTPTQTQPFLLTNNPFPSIGVKYLYAFHDDINVVTAYEVNQKTGALKALGSAL
jgi:6-phosphogluconolactonase (cycloisomerase 2 family)